MAASPATIPAFSVLTLAELQRSVTTAAAAYRCRRRLQPGGGEGDKVFPPTFAGAGYAIEHRRVPGRTDPVTCVLLDSVQSQANRMEAALQEAVDGKEISIPVVAVDFGPYGPASRDDGSIQLLDSVGKITSLQLPHRLADAILRDSEYNGVAFRQSEASRDLNSATPLNATALYQLCPTALIFGMWDSTGPKGGLGAKFERAVVSEVVGFDAAISNDHKNLGVRRDPLEASSSVPIAKNPDGTWTVAEDPKKKGLVKPSNINHGSVPFSNANSGTTIGYAEQLTTLSLVTLRRLRFPIVKNGTPILDGAIDAAGRAVLTALALYAATRAFEPGMGLRSRCLLWPDTAMQWDLLAQPGGEPKRYTLTLDQAKALLESAIKAAKDAGLSWMTDELVLTPSKELLKLVRLSQEQKVKDSPEAGE